MSEPVAIPMILVVDDEPDVQRLLCITCEREGFRTQQAAAGQEALRVLEQQRPDLVLLDVSLPDMSGLDVCREIRSRHPELPVIMVSARGDEIDKVLGLELGADDYVTKPFGARELVARIRTQLRKHTASGTGSGLVGHDKRLQIGPLVIRFEEREVELDGIPVQLTRTEFDILRVLAENPGQVLSRDQIISRVWGYDAEGGDRVVDAHIKNLRRKVESDPQHPQLILTARQVGYRLLAEPRVSQ